ncbi:uncharacterized protein DS421_11g334110 [Arachis hypogaea]|nr:uncharacterized protein DS421_11g334110 [Arachis hypogaea]
MRTPHQKIRLNQIKTGIRQTQKSWRPYKLKKIALNNLKKRPNINGKPKETSREKLGNAESWRSNS